MSVNHETDGHYKNSNFTEMSIFKTNMKNMLFLEKNTFNFFSGAPTAVKLKFLL